MEPVISFQVIETGDPEKLIVHDFSDWGVDPTLYSAVIQITLPGAITPNTLAYSKNSYNLYNSINLSISASIAPLPDGLYTIKVTAALDPDTYELEKTYLKTDNLELALGKLYLKEYDKCSTCNVVKELKELKDCLEGAKNMIKIGEITKASANFDRVQEQVGKKTNCVNCN
jgi:hypothetical protein|tara:strand:- start:1349 stop:1864 length:516 start_codon:yes stop_codon:yes gene_type:complete